MGAEAKRRRRAAVRKATVAVLEASHTSRWFRRHVGQLAVFLGAPAMRREVVAVQIFMNRVSANGWVKLTVVYELRDGARIQVEPVTLNAGDMIRVAAPVVEMTGSTEASDG